MGVPPGGTPANIVKNSRVFVNRQTGQKKPAPAWGVTAVDFRIPGWLGAGESAGGPGWVPVKFPALGNGSSPPKRSRPAGGLGAWAGRLLGSTAGKNQRDISKITPIVTRRNRSSRVGCRGRFKVPANGSRAGPDYVPDCLGPQPGAASPSFTCTGLALTLAGSGLVVVVERPKPPWRRRSWNLWDLAALGCW